MILVRPPVPADEEGWKTLWEGYNAFYGRAGQTALPKAVTATTWRRILDPLVPVNALLAVHHGRLVGFAHFVLHMNTIMVESTCYMQDLFTSEDARGSGVGRALIEHVMAAAADHGATGVYWHTRNDNRTARRLYDALATDTGFIVYRAPVPPPAAESP